MFIPFLKVHGSKNDFLLIDLDKIDSKLAFVVETELAVALCERK